MIKKLSATSGDNTDHSLADLLSGIMKTSGNLPRSYAGLVNYLQQFLKLLHRYNDAGGNLSDLEALNILMIKLSMCPLDQLSTILTIKKSKKIKDPNYSLAKFVNHLTSWASSEVDKPSNRYQNENKQVMAVGRGSQVGRSRGNGKGNGRGRGKGKNNYNPNARYHQDTYKEKYAGRGKGSAGREKGKKGKGKGKGTDYGQQLVVHLDGKDYMRDRLCYNYGTLGHYARDCVKAWKQHNERKQQNKRSHHKINSLFNNGGEDYFDDNQAEKYLRNSSMMLFKIAEGSEFQGF